MARKIPVIVIVLVLEFFLLEGLARLTFPFWAASIGTPVLRDFRLNEARIEFLRSHFDPELGWRNLETGPHGERPMPRDHGEPFLLTFGDSFVLGDEVADDETWQTYLGDLIGKSVYNFGVAGYGPDQALLRFRKVIQDNPAPFTAIGVTRGSLYRMVNVYRKFLFLNTGIPLTKPRLRMEGDKLAVVPNPIQRKEDLERLKDPDFLRALGDADFWYQSRQRQALPLGFPYLAEFFKKRFWNRVREVRDEGEFRPYIQTDLWKDAETVRLIKAILKDFVTESRERGSRPFFILFPEKTDVEGVLLSRADIWITDVSGWCEEFKIACVNGVQLVAEKARGENPEALWAPGGHLSPLGNRALAEEIARLLKRKAQRGG